MRDTVRLYKALSDDTRLKMIWLLLRQEELCVCDFMEILALPQSTASRHLRTLVQAGLATDRRAGLWSYYALRPGLDPGIQAHLEALRLTLASSPDIQALTASLAQWRSTKGSRSRCEKAP